MADAILLYRHQRDNISEEEEDASQWDMSQVSAPRQLEVTTLEILAVACSDFSA